MASWHSKRQWALSCIALSQLQPNKKLLADSDFVFDVYTGSLETNYMVLSAEIFINTVSPTLQMSTNT
jgi:hypothetical protein